MPSWNQLLEQFDKLTDPAKGPWVHTTLAETLRTIGDLRGRRNVVLYASAFLQKPQAPATHLQVTYEDLNGFMSVLFGMDCTKGLTLVLHTPGGLANAAETIVAYLRSKFPSIEVIVPAFAMSAGTMLSLGADRILMGRQSQLGPIDPQFIIGGRPVSARAVVDQFEAAKSDILTDVSTAHLWAPILQTIGPALIQESKNALAYGETMVAQWLEAHMFKSRANARDLALATAKHFNDASTHKSHGRRIDRDEARAVGVEIEDLEANQALQDAVLTAYHLTTILIEKSPTVKIFASDAGQLFMKNWGGP